jgi:isorenieratene synthase
MMEHGFHGFFPQYYNLFKAWSRSSYSQNLSPSTTTRWSIRDDYEPEVFRPSSSAFPWNVVDLAIFLQSSEVGHQSHPAQASPGISGNHRLSQPPDLSSASIIVGGRMGGRVTFPRGSTTCIFALCQIQPQFAPDVLSAGELMQFFHFYFFGNPEGLAFNGTCQDMGRSLVDPIAKAIRGQRRSGAHRPPSARCLAGWPNCQRYLPAGSVPPTRCPSGWSATPCSALMRWNTLGRAIALLGGLKAGATTALSLTCTHQGCSVQPNEVEATEAGFASAPATGPSTARMARCWAALRGKI